MPTPNNWILGVKGSLGNPESLRTRIAKSLLLGGSMFSIVNCLRTVRQQFDPRRQKFRSSKFNLIDRQQMANKQFGPAANVHIDRPHQIINSAKVVINFDEFEPWPLAARRQLDRQQFEPWRQSFI